MSKEQDVVAIYNQGMKCILQNNEQSSKLALLFMRRAIELAPHLAIIHLGEGKALYQLGRKEEALASTNTAIALYHDSLFEEQVGKLADAVFPQLQNNGTLNAINHILQTKSQSELTPESISEGTAFKRALAERIKAAYQENPDKLRAFLSDVQNLGNLNVNNPLRTYKREEDLRMIRDLYTSKAELLTEMTPYEGREQEIAACTGRTIELKSLNEEEDFPLYLEAATNFCQLNQHETAEQYSDKVLSYRPEDTSAHCYKANISLNKGEYQKAIKYANKAIAGTPSVVAAYQTKAWAQHLSGKSENAIRTYNEGLARDSGQVVFYLHKVFILSGLERCDEAMETCQKGLKIAPEYSDLHYQMAILREKRGQDQEAFTSYELAIRYNPQMQDARVNSANLLCKYKEYDKAYALYTEVLDLNPHNENIENMVKAYNGRSNCRYNQRRYEEAIAECNAALSLDPHAATSHLYKASALFDLERYDESISSYEAGMFLGPAINLISYQKYAASLHRAGRYQDALDNFSQAIKLSNNNSTIRYNKASCHVALEQYTAAIKEYEHVLKNDSAFADADFYFDYGVALGRAGNTDNALQQFTKAVELDPNHMGARYNKAICHVDADDHTRAVEEFEKISQGESCALHSHANFYCNWGASLYRVGRFTEALEKLGKALELDKDDIVSRRNKIACHLYLKAYAEVIRDVEAILQADQGEISPDISFSYGVALYESGNTEKALPYLRRALSTNREEDRDSYYTKAICHFHLREYTAAAKAFEGIFTNPLQYEKYINADSYYKYGTSLEEAGDTRKALDNFSQALQYDKDHTESRYSKAICHLKLKEYALAGKELSTILHAAPDFAGAYFYLGAAAEGEKKYKKAIECYDEAIRLYTADASTKKTYAEINKINQNRAYPYRAKAQALYQLGQNEAALECIELAMALSDKKTAPDYYSKGRILGSLGKFEEAGESYDEALRLAPEHEGALYNKSVIQQKLGEKRHLEALAAKESLEDAGFNDNEWMLKRAVTNYTDVLALSLPNRAAQLSKLQENAYIGQLLCLWSEGCRDTYNSFNQALTRNQNLSDLYQNKINRIEIGYGVGKLCAYLEKTPNNETLIAAIHHVLGDGLLLRPENWSNGDFKEALKERIAEKFDTPHAFLQALGSQLEERDLAAICKVMIIPSSSKRESDAECAASARMDCEAAKDKINSQLGQRQNLRVLCRNFIRENPGSAILFFDEEKGNLTLRDRTLRKHVIVDSVSSKVEYDRWTKRVMDTASRYQNDSRQRMAAV